MKERDYLEPEELEPGQEETSAQASEPETAPVDVDLFGEPDSEDVDSIVREVLESMSMESAPDASAGGLEIPLGEEFRDQEYRDVFDEGFPQIIDPEEEDAQEPPETPPAPHRKKRRRNRPRRKKIKKKGTGLLGIPHFLSGMIVVALVLVLGVTLARILWLWADDLLALTKKSDKEVVLSISDSDTMEEITNKLVDAGLVRYPYLFNFYCQISDAREKISAGQFTLTELDYMALVNSMSGWSDSRAEVTVTIPEGYECRHIFDLLAKNQVCTVEELEQAAMTMDLSDYWFLEEITREDRENPYCLEGFLFPDTYDFYTSDDPERVIRKFLSDFEYRFEEEMEEALDQLNVRMAEELAAYGYSQEYIDQHKLSIRDVVIVASMIERETAGSGESATIASVIYNRLCDPDYLYLNIDATVQYALGERKPNLSHEDTQIDSPYNTYVYPGLPIGPISNPGLNSLKAALWPEDTDYYFYALDTDGTHHFTRTYEEHQAFLDELNGGD